MASQAGGAVADVFVPGRCWIFRGWYIRRKGSQRALPGTDAGPSHEWVAAPSLQERGRCGVLCGWDGRRQGREPALQAVMRTMDVASPRSHVDVQSAAIS